MERLDIDRDGKITEVEMLRVLSEGHATNDDIVESTI
jgi:Ca2+-binding EF-hand superfamily protein